MGTSFLTRSASDRYAQAAGPLHTIFVRTALSRNVQFILPHGTAELTIWIALSVTAGICEETVFRGYLQRQFIALTKSVPSGILLSAALFGAAHAYQGLRLVALISLYGAM